MLHDGNDHSTLRCKAINAQWTAERAMTMMGQLTMTTGLFDGIALMQKDAMLAADKVRDLTAMTRLAIKAMDEGLANDDDTAARGAAERAKRYAAEAMETMASQATAAVSQTARAAWEEWVVAEKANAEAYSEETAATAEEAWDSWESACRLSYLVSSKLCGLVAEKHVNRLRNVAEQPTGEDTEVIIARVEAIMAHAADTEDIQTDDAVMAAWEEGTHWLAFAKTLNISLGQPDGSGYKEARAAAALAYAAYQGAVARGKGEDAEPVIDGILRNAVSHSSYIQDYQDRLAGRKVQAEARKNQAEARDA